VFRNTVPVEAETLGGAVAMVAAVQRAPAPGSDALPCRFLSQELADWYNANASQYFTKQPLEFSARIFVDASEWGELLALAGAPYLQGIDERFDGDTSGDGNDTCGQSVCFGFTQTVSASIVTNPPDPLNITHPQFYSLEGYSWQSVFTYRRLWGAAASTVSPVRDESQRAFPHTRAHSRSLFLFAYRRATRRCKTGATATTRPLATC
jgi:hypothetical protein